MVQCYLADRVDESHLKGTHVLQVLTITCIDEAEEPPAHKASHPEKDECVAISLVQACGPDVGLKTEVPVL